MAQTTNGYCCKACDGEGILSLVKARQLGVYVFTWALGGFIRCPFCK